MVNSVSGARVSGNSNVITVRQRTIQDGRNGALIGAGIGAVGGFARKSWINNNEPTDTFVKKVSSGLEKSLKPEDKVEVDKINDFFSAVMEPTTDLSTLRPTIEDSKELTGALKLQENENPSQALDRIFDDANSENLKSTLKNMQDQTKIDKTVNLKASKALIQDNFDHTAGSLLKSESTSDATFKILKNAAKKIRVQTAVAHAIVGSVILGTIGLLVGATSNKSEESSTK